MSLLQGHTEAYLSECRVNIAHRSVLEVHHVYYVKQVFKGYQHGDTLRMVGNEVVQVQDLSEVYVFYQNVAGQVINAVDSLRIQSYTLYADPNFIREPDLEPPSDQFWDYLIYPQ